MSNIHGFSKACLKLYKNKLVEINTGEQKTTIMLSDFEEGQRSLIRGVLLDAIGDGIIVECKIGRNKKKVLINVWSIISMVEVDSTGSMKDVYVDEELRRRRRT